MAGFIFLGERLNPFKWLGCRIIFLAAILPLLYRLRAEKPLDSGKTG